MLQAGRPLFLELADPRVAARQPTFGLLELGNPNRPIASLESTLTLAAKFDRELCAEGSNEGAFVLHGVCPMPGGQDQLLRISNRLVCDTHSCCVC